LRGAAFEIYTNDQRIGIDTAHIEGETMPTKEEETIELARIHYEVEEGMTHIFRIIGPAEAETNPSEPIKLLEVNESTIPSGILPLRFGPLAAAGIHYPSVIVEITPEEYQKIRTEELKLPFDWNIGELIPKPQVENGR
jgi:hypothetical protein